MRTIHAATVRWLGGMLALAVGLGCAAGGQPRAPRWERQEYRQVCMGVQARIVLWTREHDVGVVAARAAFARLAEVERALSDWLVDGEVARLESRAGLGPVPASDDLHGCLERALAIARASDGAFDPTVGALTRLWRAARADGVRPDAAALDAARATVGWRAVRLDAAARTVELARADTRLDLGGIGKGWGADMALATLAEHKVERALVALGGDVALGAPPPHAAGWSIDAPEVGEVLELEHCGVSSSGDSQQFLLIDGERTSHLLEPRSGVGVVGRAAVTVVAADAATADGLASAVSVAGPKGEALVRAAFPGARILRPNTP
ncbi:MAG TPA: FAD:protein FMN transferase [Planctomycetota bacterium]|nr:FAD:protein FMN transferase [Planctomycetota bacterium]